MSDYQTRDMNDLARQLRRGPKGLCLKRLANIEFALSVVESDKRYPADFVWQTLTGVRRHGSRFRCGDLALVSGRALRQDLVTLAQDLSEHARLTGAACGEPVYSITELADRFGVSARTVARWRRRGLVGWMLTTPGGRRRLAFPDRCVRRFVAENAAGVRRAAAYSQVSGQERQGIIERARQLAGNERCTMNSAVQAISADTGRAPETIRLILKRYDEDHPGNAVFGGGGAQAERDAGRLQIWEAYQDGSSLKSLADRFGLSTAAVYAIVTEMRACEMKSRPIEYMHSEDFTTPDAEAGILGDPAVRRPFAPLATKPRVPADLPPYLGELMRIPLLRPDGERALFRQMNYLKYRAELLRQAIVPGETTARELDRIESLLDRARKAKNQITNSNLRLVVSIARQHLSTGTDLFELVSEGNVALLRAVDLFDFSRGFKFSTYASWAIKRRLARLVARAHQHRARHQTPGEDFMDNVRASEDLGDSATAARELVQRMSASLSPREWFILSNHYGLHEPGESLTLAQLGRRVGVSGERVRQIESEVFARLRRCFAEEHEQRLP
jgi:RNA polymerase sigma factor (sigma-70 family)